MINISDTDELFDIYLTKIEGVKIEENSDSNIIKKCKDCDVLKIIQYTNGLLTCPECGNSNILIIDEDTYKIRNFHKTEYKHGNHFNEWFILFKTKELNKISQKVYDDIITEIKLNKITKLNVKTMRRILYRLKLSYYNEHIVNLINIFKGTLNTLNI
jgi:predicted RNA-binding Zn-ribbon protein involved in translation (DUF1610 family)